MDEVTPSCPALPLPPVQLTPMMEQYQGLKDKAGDALLFFRMGDFYELFQQDAIVAAQALQIALTARHKHQDEPIPMCGVPVHSAEVYVDRLLQQGFKVAIAEQIEDPKQATGLVKRDIIRTITPGTITNSNALVPKAYNFLASIAVTSQGAGFAYMDVSAGIFAVTTWEGTQWQQALQSEYERIQPREVLLPDPLSIPLELLQQSTADFPHTFQPWSAQYFRPEQAYRVLTQHFAVQTLDGFGCEGHPLAIAAAGSLLSYVHSTQQNPMVHLASLRFYSTADFMGLDDATRRHLELFHSPLSQGRTGSLLEVLDTTVTAMGGRLLRQWLSQPLRRLQPLQARQEAVHELVEAATQRATLRQALTMVTDFERVLSRLALGSVLPRELVALQQSIEQLPALAAVLHHCRSAFYSEMLATWDPLDDLAALIRDAIVEEPPSTLRDGRVIRPGYNATLDALRAHDTSGKTWLTQFEIDERQRTGITSLKVGFNKVFGYYIEVRKAHLGHIPAEYLRKQTLAHAERFITPTLKEREVLMLRAEEQALALEQQLYAAITQQLAQHAGRLQHMAQTLSQLDVLAALADVAVKQQYCRPTLDTSTQLRIEDGRHPLLEVRYYGERFVPNDTFLDRDTQQILLLTGPNMAGKSTYMRQIGLIVVLAQMGSFVPARAAHIGLVDRIFTRIGAHDVLLKGHSTFMVEMTETANILHNMTAHSLVILDEVGRGTSTYDGMSIAWAVIEYLHHAQGARPRTLFATHYHELTALASRLGRVRNYNAAVQESGDQIVFLRKICPGSADRSYGVHVARLAGLPAPVLTRAQQLLTSFEATASTTTAVGAEPATPAAAPLAPPQLSLFDMPMKQLLHELRTVPVTTLSLQAAYTKLLELQQKAQRLP